ncbi:hypothetical protein SAMN04487894_10563 [Niabella drilacis]|uniref:Uncharacterized protein n=1 Tax=Niabella drilacis (strain DSM 25811 / CCM 8410 / CCUG 62505 / LMG 26954 / E90) TaxID=1285928 RepID=A0A1G6QXR7_NIADE|nr:hypothetical protein SAMN04487894_10563 [Niabella drilacis]
MLFRSAVNKHNSKLISIPTLTGTKTDCALLEILSLLFSPVSREKSCRANPLAFPVMIPKNP